MTSLPGWLRTAVFYQVYPQSFQDSNADGIGDLPGLISRLGYIRDLGCDAIWLNPCFVSPFRDAGYDVADFYRVAPRYGTNRDLKTLFRKAGRLGIRICLDLVAGHTSDQHPWFQKSSRANPTEFKNRYIWTDDWLTSGGPKFIRGASERNGQYAVNFFACQPALNYGFAQRDPAHPWQLSPRHPDVQAMREELLRIMRFWLDAGAAGFRVDMAASLVKNDPDKRATIALWRKIRREIERDYPEAVLISEWGHAPQALKAGFHVDLMLHTKPIGYAAMFRAEPRRNIFRGWTPASLRHSFFDRAGRGDISAFLSTFMEHLEATRKLGHMSVPSGCHDMPRISQGRDEADLAVVFAFLLTLPGIPFIYYGDEIGLRHRDKLPSKEGGYTRTGARTPMQWDRSPNAGFSRASADRLYLPIDPDADRPCVADLEKRPDSLLQTVRALIRLRREHPALGADGDCEPVYARKGKYPLAYIRARGRDKIWVAVNPAARPVSIPLPSVCATVKPLMSRCAVTQPGRRGVRLNMEGVSFWIGHTPAWEKTGDVDRA